MLHVYKDVLQCWLSEKNLSHDSPVPPEPSLTSQEEKRSRKGKEKDENVKVLCKPKVYVYYFT